VTVSIAVVPAGAGNANLVTQPQMQCAPEYISGTPIAISAVYLEGHNFVEWTQSADGVFEDKTLTETNFAPGNDDVIITANFTP
jgi:hypothetical protein